METILKPRYLIELPQEICCKLDLMPGTRLEVEADEKMGECPNGWAKIEK